MPQPNTTGPYPQSIPPSNTTDLNPGSIPWVNKNYDVRRDETPREERAGLSESEQPPEFAPANWSLPSDREATIKGLVTPPEERGGSTVNDQYSACTPSTSFHQDPKEDVESKEAAVTNTTKETIGAQKDLSDAVPSTTSPSKGQREPVANKELCEGNTTNGTTVTDAESARGPALLHEKQQSGPKSVPHEGNTNESTARITMASTKRPQKAPETQDHLGSGSEIRNTKNFPQVSNKTYAVKHLRISLSNKCAGVVSQVQNVRYQTNRVRLCCRSGFKANQIHILVSHGYL